MAKKDNIIDFRDYQPGKRETIETHDLDAFRATLYDLGFLGSSSSDSLDETEEVAPEIEVEETEAVEEPTVEVDVEETTDPVTEEGTSEADDESEGESMVEETEPDDEPEVVESEDDDSESDDEEEPEIVDEDDSDDDDFLSEDNEEDDDEEIEEEPEDKLKAPGESLKTPLSDLIIKETERGFKHFDPDEPLVEDDDSDEEIEEAEFKEVDSESEEESSESEEEAPVSRRKRHKHAAPSGAGTRFPKKLGNSFANSLLSNFGLGETPAVQPSKAAEEESKTEDSTTKSEFNSKAQELLSKEIMGGKVDKLKEWSKNDNVNKLMFLFSGNSVLSDWIMENEPDIFWDLPDEVIDVILEKNKKSSEKKDDKDEKKS